MRQFHEQAVKLGGREKFGIRGGRTELGEVGVPFIADEAKPQLVDAYARRVVLRWLGVRLEADHSRFIFDIIAGLRPCLDYATRFEQPVGLEDRG